ncbi:MAG: DEAD/DEAH box helicase [Desulfobacterales bacterium]|nr:DEAD/DEAH box helicase [Desulfobacterales bacterium]
MKESRRLGPGLVHHQWIPRQETRSGKLARPLFPELAAALARLGIDSLYRHQAEAVDAIRAGKDILISTPTASGKSLIYNLPVFEKILGNRDVTALYLFPLKALAQDQLRAVSELSAGLADEKRFRTAIYDGDTSATQRRKLRENPPRILISNPDMLHLALLPFHDRWAGFFSSLSFIILDEAHTFRGIFGSHMAWVIRRLQRICRHYGADPKFIMCSATVGNPLEMAENLLGRPVTVVTRSGAPRAGRHFLLINPLDSTAHAASLLLEQAISKKLRTIVYTQSRKMTELISIWTRTRLKEQSGKLTAYRAGFLPGERRKIEKKLSSGDLLGVVSTSALELGIDIGDLDICILSGYPGTMTATWQRSGRVGRRERDSLVILVAREDALDQYFMRHPDQFFSRKVEAVVLNPDNEKIIRRHLVCAAGELPLEKTDPILGNTARDLAGRMAEQGNLLLSADGNRYHTGRRYPHRQVNLRGSSHPFRIFREQDRTLLGEIDGHRCLRECHPGAVYLHQGCTYVISSLDLETREVIALARKVSFFTRPLSEKETTVLEILDSRQVRGCRVNIGRLRVIDRIIGFQRRQVRGQGLINTERLELPPQVFETEGIWFEIPDAVAQEVQARRLHFMGGIHAIEHAAIGIFPLLVLCDRNDVGGIAYPFHPQLKKPAIFIYDGHPGGIGLARQAFNRAEELLANTLDTIRSCGCEIGCPSCVHSPKCGSGNRPMDKKGAQIILELLGRETGVVAEKPVATKVIHKKTRTIRRAVDSIHYGVFDLETIRSADAVGGWHRAERMGVSVAVLYDSATDTFTPYLEHQLDAFIARLQGLGLVVGFNTLRFDNRVLSAYTSFDLARLPSLDILAEIRNRLGYRLSLDHLAQVTLGVKKSANGLMALKWYQEGRMEELAQYCSDDVRITRDLYRHGLDKGFLLFKNKAGSTVRCPVDFARGG